MIKNIDNFGSDIESYLKRKDLSEKMQNLCELNKPRVHFDLDHMRNNGLSSLVDQIIMSPQSTLKVFVDKIKTLFPRNEHFEKKGKSANAIYKESDFEVSFIGNLGRNLVSPRGLSSSMLFQYVAVQGIVTKMNKAQNKMIYSCHLGKGENNQDKGSIRYYPDNYNITRDSTQYIRSAKTVPTKDTEGNSLNTEFGYCKFKDSQTLFIQEMPEHSPIGQLPKTLEVILEDDLVDSVKPGDRVTIYGCYKAYPSSSGKNSVLNFKTVLIACHMETIASMDLSENLTHKEIKQIKDFINSSQKTNLLEKVSKSIAPQIHGFPEIKQAILLQLIGGKEKVLENGFKIRGDVNMLLVGDPGTAKSQFLRYVLSTAPLAIHTTGKTSSGVGLTASICIDKINNERTLEAGAMVLADGGVVCIDEFDKMNEVDRVAIHEVMEQQTVTIAKAGIHASLNARCSVLAAANPILGEYNSEISPMKNICMPDSLLSRFDLLFIVLDKNDAEQNQLVAKQVLNNHRLSEIYSLNQQSQYNQMIQPQLQELSSNNIYSKTGELSSNFVQKLISYCKNQKKTPNLQDEAINYLSSVFVELRQISGNEKTASTIPITIRTFETLIRLATAVSKLRLGSNIELQDAKTAYNLLYYSLNSCYPAETDKSFISKSRKGKKMSYMQEEKKSETSEHKEIPKKSETKQAYKSRAQKVIEDMSRNELVINRKANSDEKQSVFRAISNINTEEEIMVQFLYNYMNENNMDNIPPSLIVLKDALTQLEAQNKIMFSDSSKNSFYTM